MSAANCAAAALAELKSPTAGAARDDARFRGRAGALEDHVAVRHVEEMALARVLARVAPDQRAGAEGVAERAARAALADQRDARLVVAEERLGPLRSVATEAVLDLVVRGLEARVVRVGNRDVVPVRRRGRAGARVDVLDVLVAVAEVGVEAARPRAPGLARVDREDRALALVACSSAGDPGCRVRAAVGPRAVDRPAVRRRADLLQADVLPQHLVLDARVDEVRGQLDVPGQRVLDAEVPAVLRGNLEVRVDRVDRAVIALRSR